MSDIIDPNIELTAWSRKVAMLKKALSDGIINDDEYFMLYHTLRQYAWGVTWKDARRL